MTDAGSTEPLPHRLSFEATLEGRSGASYEVRFDFDALFAIETKTQLPPLQLVSLMGALSPSLSQCLILVHEGMACHGRHHGFDRKVTDASAKRATADVGINEICEKLARPLTAAYGFGLVDLEEEPGDGDDASDPPIATAGG